MAGIGVATEAEQAKTAAQLAGIFKVRDVPEFKKRLIERVPVLGNMFRDTFWRLDFKFDQIGTR
jgi:hypothetical protein